MREIKFRGKRLDNGKWIIGDLLRMDGCTFIFPDPAPDSFDRYMIDPSTVGQFTGLLDKNGKEIWEGDILSEILHPQIYYGDGHDCYNIHHGLIRRCEVIYNNLQTSFELKTIYLSETGVMVGSKFKTEIAIGDRYSLGSIDGYTPKCKSAICGNIHDNNELLKQKTMKFQSKYDIGDTVTIEQENGKNKVLITGINATKISGREVGISYVGETTTHINFCEDAITELVFADNSEQVNPEVSKKTFVPESVSEATPDEINIKVDSYVAALKYLGRAEAGTIGVSNKHAEALLSIYRLITIAEAWNKADEFVPDFDNRNQYKWFPTFRKRDTVGFIYAGTAHTAIVAYANFGSRLCFKSAERATQFGKQFIDLWNDFLLFR